MLCGLSAWFFWSASKTTPKAPAPKDALAVQEPATFTPAAQAIDRLIANAPGKKTQAAIQVNTNLVVRTNVMVQAPSPALAAPPVMTVAPPPPVPAETVTKMVTTEKTKPTPVDAQTQVSLAPFPKLKLQG